MENNETKMMRVRPRVVKSHLRRIKNNLDNPKNGLLVDKSFYALEINVTALTKQFYTLVAMTAAIKPEYGKHSHDKWLDDFYSYRNNFYSKFAKMLYDYICLIVLGELRHANNHSNYGFDTLENFSGMSREQVFCTYREFTKESVLKVGIKQFNEFYNPWHNNYGGHNWRLIAEGGLKYGKYSDEVFIDHCFDLEHNNGCIFNEEGFLFYYPDNIQDLLDTKRYCKNPIELLHWGQTKKIQELIERACNIGIISIEILEFFSDDPYIIRFDRPEIIAKKKFAYRYSTFYGNQFFKDEDRLMKGYDKYDLDDFMEIYHPLPWGHEDMTQIPRFRTDKDYDENGYNLNRDCYRDKANNY